MRVSDSGGGWSATTDFENYSHAQLVDMVNGSAPASVSSIATTLNSASTQIQSMSDDLNAHITQLQWGGSAGDAFRTWGRQVVQAMDELAIFHGNAGLAVQTAGDTLSSVKAGMPPVPTADIKLVHAYVQQESLRVSNPPAVLNGRVQVPAVPVAALPGQISQSDAYAAQGRADAAHQEAISQMEKLGGAYNGATQTMDINSEPQFPPPPNGMMPPRGGGRHSSVDVTGPTGNSGGGGTVRPPNSHVGGGGGLHSQPVGGGGQQTPPPPKQSGGVATLQGTHAPTAGPGPVKTPGTSAGPGTNHGQGGGPMPPGTGPGVFTPTGTGRGTGRGGLGKGELPPQDHLGDPGIGGGDPRGGAAGGVKAGRPGDGGGEISGGLGGGSAEGNAGVTGGGGGSSSTARSALHAEETTGVSGAAGEAAGQGAGGQMMGGGMGGAGHAGGRRRSRAGRAAYLSEDEETWESDSARNPAVIE